MTSGSRDAAAAESAVSAIISEALDADAAGRSADTLYNTSAIVIVNGRTRNLRPMFAGIGSGGHVSITSSQLELRNSIGWGLVDYRWEMQDSAAREGRATFVLTQDRAGQWRIQHLHSSSPQ
jgi:ketosteroid isomerase-like protein